MGFEKLLDTEGHRRLKDFEEKLLLIEAKYIDFFKEREPTLSSEKHDKIHHHYRTWYVDGEITFKVKDDSELPGYVKKECYDLFKETVMDSPDSI